THPTHLSASSIPPRDDPGKSELVDLSRFVPLRLGHALCRSEGQTGSTFESRRVCRVYLPRCAIVLS
ncbi:MAG: hypothetical protein ACM3ZE_26040, partial [Myxococcales bacterium]